MLDKTSSTRFPCSVFLVFDKSGGPPEVHVEADLNGAKLRWKLDVVSVKMPSGAVAPVGVTAVEEEGGEVTT